MLKVPNCKSLYDFNQISQKSLFDSNDIKSQNENENLKEIKSIFDFISGKNKIILKSCFDEKGAKKFLYDKEKAMAKFVIPDEIKEENLIDKRNKKSPRKNDKKDTKNFRSESENCLKLQKITKKIDKKEPVLKSELSVNVSNCHESKKNKGKLKVKIDKRKVSKLSSINSTFSNIQCKEPLNLAINNNDSFIHSIINEMVTKN